MAKLVELHRLVTVVGPGGAGKTTVAVELARRLVGGYADGVWLVELAGLRDPALLAEVVAAALGLREEAGEPESPPRRPTGWPASSATSACCWSWTTASTWSGHAPSWSSGCSEAGPGLTVLATSREVLGVAGEAVWPVPPLAVPDADDERAPAPPWPAPTATGSRRRCWPATTRCGCSASGRRPPTPASSLTRASGRWWPSCAGAWTGCRWPSSWPRPGCGSCRWPRSRAGWGTGSGCWPGVGGPSTPASRRCGPPSTGAGSCWTSPTGGCGGGCRCSSVAGRSRRRRRSARATGWRRRTCWRGCSGWSTGRWWWPPGGCRPGSRCWRPCGTTGPSGWPRPARPTPWRPGTPPGSWTWPSRPPSTAPPGAGCGCCTPTTTTCGRCWTGRWRAATWTPPCGWPAPSAGTGRPTAPSRAASDWRGWPPWPTGGRRPAPWPGCCRRRRWPRCSRRRPPAPSPPPGAARSCSSGSGTGGVASPSCCGAGPPCSCAAPAATSSAWPPRPRRPSPSWATAGARPSPRRAGSCSRSTPRGCRNGPRRRPGWRWPAFRRSTTSGGWPRRSSAWPRWPGCAATSAGRSPPASGRWPPPATGGRCG